MLIEKYTSITPMTTDSKKINLGDKVIFEADGRCFTGTYQGISVRGAVMFKSVISGSDVTFNVMPKSISKIYLVGSEGK